MTLVINEQSKNRHSPIHVLIVCSGNFSNSFEKDKAFVYDQVKALSNFPITFEYFFIHGKGLLGYLSNYKKLISIFSKHSFDLIHAHGGLSALLVNLQRRIPVVATYHGSDINSKKQFIFSLLSNILSKWNIFVSYKLFQKVKYITKKKYSIIPCGVDLNVFYPIPNNRNYPKKKVLFSSSFSNLIKNYPLASAAISNIPNTELLELNNKSRFEVHELLNECDALLLTSYSEGSPQIVKEAMACNCPIVATDVGDIRDIIGTTKGCFLCSFELDNVVSNLNKALALNMRTNGRMNINSFSNVKIAEQIYKLYLQIIND